MTRVLLDVDGVLCDFVSGYCALVKEVTGHAYTLADVKDYDFTSFGLTDRQRERVERLLFGSGFVLNLNAIPGAYEGLSRLKELGATFAFVTSPWMGHPTWASEREAWLEERWPGVPVVSTAHKWLVSGDVLIDDKASHVGDWNLHHPRGTGLLWNAPYNTDSQLKRVASWDDVAREVFGSGRTA